MTLEWIIISTILVSLVSLAGIVLLAAEKRLRDKLVFLLVSFSAGTFLGAALLDLLPEALETLDVDTACLAMLAGIIVFFVLEKVILWHHHHHHHGDKSEKPVGYLNLAGDLLHNFFDGVAIAASFIASIPLGITTTIAVMLHEIPQELGDYSLLLYSGFSKRKAVLFNFLTALSALSGGIAFYYFSNAAQAFASFAIPFAAGTFVYMAGADVFPELHKETNPRKSLAQLACMLAGIATIYFATKMLGV